MKSLTLIAAVLASLLPWLSIQAQGTFQNLDFEQANPVSVGVPYVTAASAFPFWNVYYGSTPQNAVAYNTESAGGVLVDLFGPNNGVGDPGIIDGNYSVGLQAGFGPGLALESASLWQDGTVPANSESLQFKGYNFAGATPLSVSFAGDSLSLFVLSSGVSPSGQPYNVYGANIAPFSGQTGQLEFTATFSGAVYNSIVLDDISFSPQAIPEPSPIVLSGIGVALFAFYRRFGSKLK